MSLTRRSFVKKSAYSAAAVTVLGTGVGLAEGTNSGQKKVIQREEYIVVITEGPFNGTGNVANPTQDSNYGAARDDADNWWPENTSGEANVGSSAVTWHDYDRIWVPSDHVRLTTVWTTEPKAQGQNQNGVDHPDAVSIVQRSTQPATYDIVFTITSVGTHTYGPPAPPAE